MKYLNTLCVVLIFALTLSFAAGVEVNVAGSAADAVKSPEKRGIFGYGYGHGFGGYHGHGHYGYGHGYPSYGYAVPFIGYGHYHGHGFYH